MRTVDRDPRTSRVSLLRLASVAAALVGLTFTGLAHAQDDCAAKKKALKAAERKAATLQNKLRKLLTKGALSDADKASLAKTQEALGPAGEQVDQLEAAAKGCTVAAKPKKPKKPKKAPKVVAEPEPAEPPKPEPAKPEPPKPEPPQPAVATPFPAAPPPASEPVGPSVAVCSGGPRAWSLSSAGVHVHGPSNVARYEWENARSQHRKRAVTWALEMPHRCAPSPR